MTDQTILVIGAGSIGERHVRNLKELGVRNIVVLRSRRLPLRTISEDELTIVTSFDEGMQYEPIAAVICTPTSMHMEQALQCLTRGLSVLVEKPLSHSTESLDKLESAARENGCFLQVGYMMRFHPLLLRVKEHINRRDFGGLVHAASHWGEYLPDWHPWEDYRESYAARKDLGGGAGLTLSHDLDVALWMLGDSADAVSINKNTGSSLEVDVEVAVDVLLRNKEGITATVHQNFFERIPRRFYTYLFDTARLHLDYFGNQLTICQHDKEDEIIQLHNFDRNDMFLDQSRDFIRRLNTPEDWKNYTTKQISGSRRLLNALK